jgi:hypothetical protein
MRRKTFDALLTTGGLLIAAVLLIAGGLLTWAHSFVNDQVRAQLSQQQIFFPKAGDPQLNEPEIGPYLTKYAGQQLTNGAQAQACCDPTGGRAMRNAGCARRGTCGSRICRAERARVARADALQRDEA